MRRIPFLLFALLALLAAAVPRSQAQTTPDPDLVVIAGTIQSVLGCPGDWAPDCDVTALAFDETHQFWLATFDLPAGSYEYKAALNGTWDESYGLGAEQGGPNLPLELSADTRVTFLYDHKTGYVADNVTRFFANLPGNFNAAIGCPDTAFDDPGVPGNWAPDCWQTLLQDPDGDGLYTWTTNKIPPGNYETKVAVGGSWGENYGDGGAPGGANIGFTVAKEGTDVLFSWNSETKVLTVSAEGAPKGNLTDLSAWWVAPDLILVQGETSQRHTLHFSADATLTIDESGITNSEPFPLTPAAGIPPAVREQFPHLVRYTPLQLPPAAVARAGELLRGQLAVASADAEGNPLNAIGVQLPGVLDALHTWDGPLGVTWDGDTPTLRLWAPTAQTVRLHLFGDDGESAEILPMQRDDAGGVWSVTGAPAWKNRDYLYEVTVYAHSVAQIVTNLVTDPYSLGLALNSTRSRIVDLNDPAWIPAGWGDLVKPTVAAPEDSVIYELHVRDFSVQDQSVSAEERGTYLAFTRPESDGMRHLQALAGAGLTHLHLLPTFDLATINEDKSAWQTPLPRYLAGFSADSPQQQQAVNLLRDADGFNWGYDPYHYTVPEGSYAVNADARILEYRQMVQAINQTGLLLAKDVVYNHTNAAGQSDRSVLDKIVPGYYHRLNSKGRVETSTCCPNTATEHAMMRKLMVDSLIVWARDYKIDAFRFDLMGHHMVSDMQAVRAALDSLTPEQDGVDGKAIYLYGEGWDFGEVANNARGVNATQRNLAGTGIGTFNDRLRDAVRGGSPFGGEQEQGFATGLYTSPNATDQGSAESQRLRLLLFADLTRVGLAGNLADYTFQGYSGSSVRGAEVSYNGSPAGYTADPQENIVYVSKHDNQTLYDTVTYKLPVDTPMADRVRHQNLALDLVMFSQGVPFFHAGSDMLRSKSFDRDSYNSGDWFNALDFTYTETGYGRGLPIADKNENNWPIIAPLLANPDLKPDQAAILANVAHFRQMLQIRQSSPLFRLQSADAVQSRLRFHNTGPDQIPGLIVMSMDDSDPAARLDPRFERIVVLFNGTPDAVSFPVAELADVAMGLHPVLAESADAIVRTATFADGTFSVPARTTAIFVAEREGGETETETEGEVVAGPTVVPTVEAVPEPPAAEAGDDSGDGGVSPVVWVALLAGAGALLGALLAWRRRR